VAGCPRSQFHLIGESGAEVRVVSTIRDLPCGERAAHGFTGHKREGISDGLGGFSEGSRREQAAAISAWLMVAVQKIGHQNARQTPLLTYNATDREARLPAVTSARGRSNKCE